MRVKVIMPKAATLIHSKGLDANGHVQLFHTMNVHQRIGKYMPHLTGTLETKLKHIRTATEIEVLGPYAKYQYHGKVMLGKAPKVLTNKPLQYTKTFNPKAGPYWDRALVAAEGKQMLNDIQKYINSGRK